MRGDADVINTLNDLLAGELTAIDQYFLHSRMYENWGYAKLYERIEHERQDETGHATALIKRILFLEGAPVLDKRDALRIGKTVPEMLRNDLDLELEVVADLRMAIALCEQKGDFVTREILEQMLDDTEEDHAYWLEIQLRLIDQIGLQNYLQSQMS
ncbi:MAG TPA: bacterioferritin [Rhodocyclaceae bacterium]|nr:bacterioferritin [Rhodocyclaceae bacterium]